MELENLLDKLKLDHLEHQLDAVCEQAANQQLDYKTFLVWGEIFNDPVLATAVLDRLLHYSTSLNIKGESYRLKEKRKAGLLGRSLAKEEKEVLQEA